MSLGYVMKPLSPSRPSILTALDIGSTKVACAIAKLRPAAHTSGPLRRTHKIEVLGIAAKASQGVQGGRIVDLDAAESVIREVVDQAEREAGVTAANVIVCLSGGDLQTHAFNGEIELNGLPVTSAHIGQLLALGRRAGAETGQAVLHALPIRYALDGHSGIAEPVGMVGRSLSLDMQVTVADALVVENLARCLERCHLKLAGVVAAPYAAALACLDETETTLGAVCLDAAGGTTTAAAFQDNCFLGTAAIGMGGQHVTKDLAHGLSISLAEAERTKTMHGTAFAGPDGAPDSIAVEVVEGNLAQETVPRALLSRIIAPRVEEVLELMRDRLAEEGLLGLARRRLVLVGGASQLTGFREAVMSIFDLAGQDGVVRHGRPLGFSGLAPEFRGPGFAGLLGLFVAAQHAPDPREPMAVLKTQTRHKGYMARLGQWLRESF